MTIEVLPLLFDIANSSWAFAVRLKNDIPQIAAARQILFFIVILLFRFVQGLSMPG
jgi:hypothetical protein